MFDFFAKLIYLSLFTVLLQLQLKVNKIENIVSLWKTSYSNSLLMDFSFGSDECGIEIIQLKTQYTKQQIYVSKPILYNFNFQQI